MTWKALVMLSALAVFESAHGADPSRFRSPDDGAFDVSGFLDEKYGFLPVLIPITEPAVGFGGALGVMFLDQPLGKATPFDRPNVSVVGGLATANGTWGAMGGDLRHWLGGRLQTLVGLVTASVNLDFHGIGEDSVLADNPLHYNLEPTGGMVQGKYRLGNSRFWAGASYAYASTDVTFDIPALAPDLPGASGNMDVGGITPSFTFDSRDNMFTPLRGAYVEASAGFFDPAFGGDDEFQRARVIGMQFFALSEHPVYFGYRAEAAASFGDVPFYLRPYITLRGVPVMRYQGEETAQLEAEVRWQFRKRWSVVGFAGFGAAWSDLDGEGGSETVPAGGAGFRYEIARKYGIHMGVDGAIGPDGTAAYVQVGSAWARP